MKVSEKLLLRRYSVSDRVIIFATISIASNICLINKNYIIVLL